jgi:molybdate transport system substrate-binding protein
MWKPMTSTANPVGVVKAFQASDATGATDVPIRVCHNSTGALVEEINKGGSGFDVFLAANDTAPNEITVSHTSPFDYTKGIPVLWAPNTSLSLNNGDVADNPAITMVEVANPETAPYGAAAKKILGDVQWQELKEAVPTRLHINDNIELTYEAVETAGATSSTVGFVAKSQICNSPPFSQRNAIAYPAYALIQAGTLLPATPLVLATTFKAWLLTTGSGSAQDILIEGFCYAPLP